MAWLPAYQIQPHVGIPPIRLGMTPGEVLDALGPPSGGHPGELGGAGYYNFGPLQVTLFSGIVEQLVVAGGPTVGSKAYCRGLSIFDTPALEVVEFISNDGEPEWEDGGDPDQAYSVRFRELDLVLGRHSVPADYPPDYPEDEDLGGRIWTVVELMGPGFPW